MRQRALENEGDGLEAPVRMRPERQPAIVGGIDLRPVMVEEQERIELVEPRTRQWPAGREIADIVADRSVLGDDSAWRERGHEGFPR